MARQGTSRRAESDAGIATILVDKSEMRSRVPDLTRLRNTIDFQLRYDVDAIIRDVIESRSNA